VASTLRNVPSLALRGITISGATFFTELASACKGLHTLILDKVGTLGSIQRVAEECLLAYMLAHCADSPQLNHLPSPMHSYTLLQRYTMLYHLHVFTLESHNVPSGLQVEAPVLKLTNALLFLLCRWICLMSQPRPPCQP
jgi:hypothetical protein